MPGNRRAVAVALAFAALPVPSIASNEAGERRDPCCGPRVHGYRNFTRQVLASCSRWVQVRYRESISVVDAGKLDGCIEAGRRESREQLDAALRTIERRKAREALWSYQLSFEAALAGVAPTRDEPAAAYDQRQSSLRHLLAHAWTRYELEER